MIDLRSDTVTKPSEEMKSAMISAEVGDDVYGEDPAVNELEEYAADKVDMESALFASSGTQSNLLALMSHCERGDEYIVGQTGHTYRYEAGGAAVLGSIQPQPLDFEPDGSLALDKVAAFIKPDDFHFAKTRLLCLENTQGGKILPLSYLSEACDFARSKGLSLHLDGARVFNAAIGLGVDVKEICQYFDSISIGLSKGLGAPVGSILCGSKTLIDKARRYRKMLGGGMRQAGYIAAGGLYALKNNITRLEQDHQNAQLLAEELMKLDEIEVVRNQSFTNMVFMRIQNDMISSMSQYLKDRGVLITSGDPVRLVTHLDISTQDIHEFIKLVKSFYQQV